MNLGRFRLQVHTEDSNGPMADGTFVITLEDMTDADARFFVTCDLSQCETFKEAAERLARAAGQFKAMHEYT